MRKTLILDCDGVLYPTSQLSLRDFVSAMKRTAKAWGISDEEYNTASQASLSKNAKGMFNFVLEMTKGDMARFDRFCADMFDRVDYTKITRDDVLKQRLKDARKTNDVVILTNNHQAHLEKVLNARFGESCETVGVPCFDIRSTEKDGMFHPKQSEEGLLIFCEKIGKKPNECVLVDDTPVNISAARKIGMGGCLISEKMTLSNYLEAVSRPPLFGKGYARQ